MRSEDFMSKAKQIKLKNNGKRRLPPYRTIKCPMVGHQATWCRGLCIPSDGHGICGRVAAHAMKGRTQIAIAEYNKRVQELEKQTG
jgi:hypothetical protein